MTADDGRSHVRQDQPASVITAPDGQIEPAPRRIRTPLGGRTVVDSTRARYVWEVPFHPRYHIPVEDIDRSFPTLDAVEFCRVLSGRAPAVGLLTTPVPF